MNGGTQSYHNRCQIIAFIFYIKSNHLMKQTIFFNKYILGIYNHGKFNLFICFKQPKSNVHGHSSSIEKVDNQNKHTPPPWNIHKSKLVKTIVTNIRFSETCKSIIFLIAVKNISSKETKHEDIGIKSTSKVECFCEWKRACKPCKCKTSNLQRTYVVPRHIYL
jgi:hypothetical protein